MIWKALVRRCYRVVGAQNGEGALAAAEMIDLSLSDIVMTEMGGGQFMDVISERLPVIPIILMSGYSEEELTV